VDSLLKLCCPNTTPLMPSEDTPTTSINATMRSPYTTTNSTSRMCQKFNIRTTPDKAALVMELVRETKSPEKIPVRQQLLRGTNVTVQSLNNKLKKYIHVPQCNDGDTTNMAFRKYKVVEQIVDTVGGGVKGWTLVLSGLAKGLRKPIVRNLPYALGELVLLLCLECLRRLLLLCGMML
jgi:hypothetical protein